MLYIKLMSGEKFADEYSGKNFTLVTIGDKDRTQFGEFGAIDGDRNPDHDPTVRSYGNTEVLIVFRENGERETYRIEGNVYIMNQAGKTIAARSPRSPEILQDS